MPLLSPYPGLRPFEVDESHLFFGREEQTDELLQRLHATRFLAVVGPSGCGKSSLVRAGMIAALGAGFMVAAGARWQFAIMRPESHPMRSLANALVEQTAIGSEEPDKEIAQGFLEATLRRGPMGVVEALRETPLPAGTNLLILVDQFEEIFRFEREGGRDEADAFVSLLLATSRQREMPVYVVITMRSDFFGDCAIFEGLPEALNESQYLTPRLTREQRRDAIVGPARIFGGDVAPDLVNRLLNEMGTDPDQLPLMQHLLMRMWTWREGATAKPGSGDPEEQPVRELTFADYAAVGGLSHALSRHADEAFAELDDRQQSIAETLFRLLSERAPGNRDIRRPTPAGEMAELAGVSLDELIAVVETFRAPGRSFIVPPFSEPIGSARVLDITHESLIRQWDRLKGWAEEEEKSAETYRRLAQTASLWQQGRSALWQSPDLEIGLDWRTRQQPTALWAKRYGGDFALAMAFLAESEKAKDAREAAAAAKRRAEIRRWRLAATSASAVALLLVAAGIVFYEAEFAEHARYYKNFVKRFGEPVGVGELSRSQVRHRAVSLKLVRKGFVHPVIQIQAVDADGNCTPDNPVGTHLQNAQEVDNTSPLHECRWDFVYDGNGEVVYEKAYDKEGQLRWGYSYTPSDERTKFRTAYYVDRGGLPAPFKNSLAEIVRFEYSESGYEIRKQYMDRHGRPERGPDRAYGQEREYDEQGLVTRMTSLDQKGQRMNDTAGNATLLSTYDHLGNLVDDKALDKDDHPVLFKNERRSETKIGYDENGNDTSKTFFDHSGHPVIDKNGVHLTKIDYDEKGYVKEVRYYDAEQNPTLVKAGFHKKVFVARDEHGNSLRWAFFGTEGEETTDLEGVHEYRSTYDSRGFTESRSAFDKQGQPTTVKNGYHRIEWRYDQDGNTQWEFYFDRDQKPTRTVNGWYRLRMRYDDRGNVTEWANFDADDQPIKNNNGYHRETAKYDPAGFRIEEELFGRNGEPVVGTNGCHKFTMSYDSRGNQTEISCFDNNGDLVIGARKFARLKKAYDGRDNTIEWAYYAPDGRRSDQAKGYAILRQAYDDQDRLTFEAYYDHEDRLTAGSEGAAILRWQYAANTRNETSFDAADQLVARSGCVTYRSTIDQRSGKVIETVCLDASGHPARHSNGSALARMKYDGHGREIEKAWYSTEGQLVSIPNYAIIRKKYDDHGNQIEEAYFGEGEKLRLGPDGYAIFRSKYDDYGAQTENAYFDQDEKLHVHPKYGYAILKVRYDGHGNEIEKAYFGEDGRLRLGPDGYAIFRRKYDNEGRETENAYFDEGEKSHIHPKYGYAVVRAKYDDSGNIVEYSAFGEDGKLRLVPDGYSSYRRKYDDRGRMIEIAYFGEGGNLRVHPNNGYAIMRKQYDDLNNEVEVAYLGEDEKLRLGPDGYAIIRNRFDDQGRRTEIAYFGEDEKPLSPPKYSYALERMKYDQGGHIIEKSYFSENGELQRQSDYAIERIKYDDRGEEIEEAYFGPDGALSGAATFPLLTRRTEIVLRDETLRLKARCLNESIADFWKSPKSCSDAANQPLVRHPVIVEVFEQSRAQGLGLLTGDVIEAYDGKPVFGAQEVIDLITQGGEGNRRIDVVREGRHLVFEAPPGRLGMRVGVTFIRAHPSEIGGHAER